MLKGLLVSAIVLIVLAVAAVSYIVPRIRVREHATTAGTRVRVETPFGSVGVDARENQFGDLGGVPIYPGAERQRKSSGGAVVDIDWGSGEKKLSITAAEFTTGDSVGKVREWYRAQLPNWSTSDKEMMHIEGSLRHVITIKEQDGSTHIGIANFGETAAN